MNFTKEIAGLPDLMKASVEQLRKVPAPTGTAILAALSVVVGTLFIPVTPTLHIGLSGIPAAVCGMYYGPIYTGFTDAIANTLKYIIRPDGPYFPEFAIDEFSTGMIYGYFFYKRKITLPRVVIARTYITVFINLISASLWLSMIYQGPLFTMVRLTKNIVMSPVDVALLYTALKDAKRMRRTQLYNIEKLHSE